MQWTSPQRDALNGQTAEKQPVKVIDFRQSQAHDSDKW
jgi:hypothetical protein